MRKDVECTFGILKGRFRLLKAGVRLDGINAVDNVWFTCCALHNWLLDIDGLTGEWKDGEPVSDWEGALGKHDDDYPLNNTVPNAVTRLHTSLNFRNYDTSGMGPGQISLIQSITKKRLTIMTSSTVSVMKWWIRQQIILHQCELFGSYL